MLLHRLVLVNCFSFYTVLLFCSSFLSAQWCSYNECDCTIWDGSTEHRGVKNVFLRCSQGDFLWKQPSGGLRVHFAHFTHQYPFKLCLSLISNFTSMVISSDSAAGLKQILTTSYKHKESQQCLVSIQAEHTLFIEPNPASRPSISSMASLHINYTITPLISRLKNPEFPSLLQNTDLTLTECRPCSDDQILYSFCNSAYVVQGSVTALRFDKLTGHSLVEIQVTRLFRQKLRRFRRLKPSDPYHHFMAAKLSGSVLIPSKCGIQLTGGQLLLTGSETFDMAVLQCVTTLDDWHRIRSTAVSAGKLPCRS